MKPATKRGQERARRRRRLQRRRMYHVRTVPLLITTEYLKLLDALFMVAGDPMAPPPRGILYFAPGRDAV
jgi:hypothetical protein